jgi:hypothetical protein
MRPETVLLVLMFSVKNSVSFTPRQTYCDHRSAKLFLPETGCWMDPVNDDEISQLGFIADSNKTASGYRSIEDWHKNEAAKNRREVLTMLNQEQAKWSSKFEDLYGDGI